MSLSRETAKKIVQAVHGDKECRSRINSILSKFPGDRWKGGARNILWAGWVKIVGYDLFENEEAYKWVCLGIAESACKAIARAKLKDVAFAIAIPNYEGSHWGAQVTLNPKIHQGIGPFVFDWWLTLQTSNPVIFLVDNWRADKGGVSFRDFKGFADGNLPHSVSKPKPPKKESSNSTSKSYTVKSGDSLSAIAKREYGNAKLWKRIYDANRKVIGKDPDLIKPNMKLVIPGR